MVKFGRSLLVFALISGALGVTAITPARAAVTIAKLAISGLPATVTNGGSLGTFTVALQDPTGNPAPQSDVRISIDPGEGGILAGTRTAITDLNGVATFSDLTLTNSTSDFPAMRDVIASTITFAGRIAKSQTVTLTNLLPPLFSLSNSSDTTNVGLPFNSSYTINSTGGAIVNYTIAPALPAGLTLDPATGKISGIASAVSPTTIYTITASNTSGNASATYSLTVNSAITAISTPPSQLNPVVGLPFSYTPISSCATANCTYSLLSGALPAGLSYRLATGEIFGTPTALDSATLVMRISDSANGSASTSPFIVRVVAGDPTKIALSALPLKIGSGSSLGTITATLQDSYGNLSPISGVTVSLSASGGILGGLLNATTVNGVATFTGLTLGGLVGTVTITASSQGLTLTPASVTTVITPGNPIKLAISGLNQSVVSGTSIGTISVSLQDLYGNTVTSSGASVNLTPSSGSLSGVTSATTNGGDLTFTGLTLTDTVAGPISITASSPGLTSISATTNLILPGPATRLTLSGVKSSIANGTAFDTLTVTLLDVNGYRALTSSTTVTISTTRGTLTGGSTSATTVNGIATFTGLILSGTAGSGSIVASASTSGITQASSAITLTAGSPSKLAISGVNSSVASGTSIGSVQVVVQDSSGNTVTTSSASITLSSTSGTLDGTITRTAVNGIATFSNVTLAGLITSSLSITAASNGLASASASTAITPGAFVALSITGIDGTTVGSGSTISPTVSLVDASGNTVPLNNVTISLTPSSGTLSGTTSKVVTNGSASFANLTLGGSAGSVTITASTGGSNPITTTATLTLVAGSPTKLAISGVNSTIPSGTSWGAIVVRILDAYGNLAKSSNANVTLTVNVPGVGVLIRNVSAVSGVATFDEELLDAPPATATFTASSSGLANASTTSTLTAGAPTRVDLVLPTNTVASGAPLGTILVYVDDSYGTQVTSSNAVVTLSVNNGASLGGSFSAPAVNGVATFTGVSLTGAVGPVTITASSSGLTSGTGQLTLTAGVVAKLAISALSSTTISGASLGPITVSLQDSYGNLVASSGLTITLSATGGTLGGSLSAITNGTSVTFTGITLSGASGLVTLKASSGQLTPATTTTSLVPDTTATKLAISGLTASTSNGGSIGTVLVTLQDANGNPVTTSGSQVTLTPSSGSLVGTSTVSTINGTATFSGLTYSGSDGQIAITASSIGLTSATASFQVSTSVTQYPVTYPVVNISVATKVALAGLNTSVASGNSLGSAITATLQDGSGNIIITSGTVITLSTSAGTLGGTLAATTVNGVATFTGVTLTGNSGAVTITASAPGLTPATATISLTDGAVAKLSIAGVNSTVVNGGSLGTISVVLLDSNGTILIGGSSKVTLAASSGTLGGTLTVAPVNGIATFTDLTLRGVAGAVTITATTGSATTTTTTTLVAGSPSKLHLLGLPTTILSGGSLGSLAVAVEDESGNKVSTSGTLITLSPSAGALSGTLSATSINGLATFTGLSLNSSSATVTITATAAGLTSGSSSLAVTAASEPAPTGQSAFAVTDPARLAHAKAISAKVVPASSTVPVINITKGRVISLMLFGTIRNATTTAWVGGLTFAPLRSNARGRLTLPAFKFSALGTYILDLKTDSGNHRYLSFNVIPK